MLKKTFKILGWFILIVFALLVATVLLLHTAPGKRFVRNKIQSYLYDNYKLTIAIGDLNYRLPDWVELNKVLLKDQSGDTLLWGGSLHVDMAMLKLLTSSSIQINRVNLQDIDINLVRKESDTSFNFQFIIDAFKPKQPKVDTVDKPLKIYFADLGWRNVRFHFKDYKSKFYFDLNSGKMETKIEKNDLNTLSFDVSNWYLAQTTAAIIDSSELKPDTVSSTSSKSTDLVIRFNKLGLRNIDVSYRKINDSFHTGNDVDTLRLTNGYFNLSKQTASANELFLNNSSFIVETYQKPVKNKKQASPETQNSKSWQINCANLDLQQNKFQYHNNYYKTQKNKIDYNHLDASNIEVVAKRVAYGDSGTRANVQQVSFAFSNGITVHQLAGNFLMTDSLIRIDNPVVRTNETALYTAGLVSIDQKNRARSYVELKFDSSYIAYNDLLFLKVIDPKTLPLSLKKGDQVLIDGQMDGTFERLSVNALTLRLSNDDLFMVTTGTVNGIDNPKRLSYDMALRKLHIKKAILSSDILTNFRKQNISIPEFADISGRVKGTTESVSPNLAITSSYGVVSVNGTISNFSNKSALAYNVNLVADKLETGKWIGMDSILGKFSGQFDVAGRGTDLNTINAVVKTRIKSFTYNKYTYSNIAIDGSLNQKAYKAYINSDDPNIISTIDLTGILDKKYPTASGTINIQHADLMATGFSKDSFTVSSMITLDVKDLHPKSLDAVVNIDSTLIRQKGERYYVDSMIVSGKAENDSSFITFFTPFAYGSLIGKYDYETLGKEVGSYASSAHKKQSDTSKNQQAILYASVKEHPLLNQFLPKLKKLDPVTITGSFDQRAGDSTLRAAVKIPYVEYDTYRIEDAGAYANGTDSGYIFSFAAKEFRANATRLNEPSIYGQYRDSLLQIAFTTNDRGGKEFYNVKASAIFKEDEKVFKITDNLLLNHQQWDVDPNNQVTLKKDGGFIFKSFNIGREQQSLRINNAVDNTVSPIEIGIDSFSISNILYLFNTDTLLADGSLFVNAKIDQPIKAFPAIDGTTRIRDLTLQKTPVGDVNIRTTADANKNITVDGAITGANTATIKGNINVASEELNLAADLQKLTAKSIETFSGGRITRTTGYIDGKIDVNGTVSKPKWTGVLNFDSTQLVYTDFNVPYKLYKQQIRFDYPFITFNNFTITDSVGHPLVLNGTVKDIGNKQFDLNLTAKTDDFIAINAPASNSNPLSGVGIVDADLIIRGNSSAADIQGKATLEDKSNINFTVPQANNYIDDRKDVIVFVDMDTVKNLNKRESFLNVGDTIVTPKLIGIKYNLNLEVKENANVRIIIDPVTGDELQIKGTAQLNAGIDDNGKLGINGIYRLKQGTYNMTYQFLKRKFQLQEGGTITFTGNPTDGIADITAQYEVEASPSDLLGNEVQENSSGLGAGFTQKIPFLVVLKIKGPLLKPQLEFDVTFKEGTAGVNATLSSAIQNKLNQFRYDVSAMNKQVFALLIMGRFIGEQSSDFFAGNGFNPSDAARQSVSRFLSEAVDQIASDLIKGVNIDLDLKNYESDENKLLRTDLNVALSKSFMNDRLSISVGKNFTVEGSDPAAKSQESSVQFIPDISTTYKLSKDGRYMVRAYRRNQYEAIMDGYFVETGLTFSITMSYNRFREIFRRNRNNSD